MKYFTLPYTNLQNPDIFVYIKVMEAHRPLDYVNYKGSTKINR